MKKHVKQMRDQSLIWFLDLIKSKQNEFMSLILQYLTGVAILMIDSRDTWMQFAGILLLNCYKAQRWFG